ncbi:glycerophosphoinositol permease [Cichlidogyrus casuarinus]|uniref:Glycerophosphoinositol permease n=1 Tax=Cichlidogyrus casuarinus TaxID=1844966 RepID=A0ABD2PZF3_9PLAT
MESDTILCGDCNATNPRWASVNRGVYLCDDCSAVHRYLGRHISQVKHLKLSRWRPTQLAMINYLAKANVNRFWEHLIYEQQLAKKEQKPSTTVQKPKPTDAAFTVKADFIRRKYIFLEFFRKPKSMNQEDLNQQLHASVRTGVLETSLYLLALGANPNAIHSTKGTTAVHVACQNSQVGQLELLMAYGGDVCAIDSNNSTPIDIALNTGSAAAETNDNLSSNSDLTSQVNLDQKLRSAWSPLMDALIGSFYEVTDGLAYYLCRRVPDHKAAVFGDKSNTAPLPPPIPGSPMLVNAPNCHFIIPSSFFNSLPHGSPSRTSEQRKRLRRLTTNAFEGLCIDVYDEAERRLTNSIMLDQRAQKQDPNAGSSLPFLPPNTAYSSVRNQARQKLGRLSPEEFQALALDTLCEAATRLVPLFPAKKAPLTPKPRHPAFSEKLPKHRSQATPSNGNEESQYDDPIYDQVSVPHRSGKR